MIIQKDIKVLFISLIMQMIYVGVYIQSKGAVYFAILYFVRVVLRVKFSCGGIRPVTIESSITISGNDNDT